MPPTLYLARHGERLDFVDPKWRDTAARPDDAPLTQLGFAQAGKLGELLSAKQVTKIYTSPFLRCIQTATAVQNQLSPKAELNVEPGLCEWLNGIWYSASEKGPIWLQPHAVFEQFPGVNRLYDPLFGYDWNFRGFPESESELLHRCDQTITRITSANRDLPGNILLVGHGSSIPAIRLRILPNVPTPRLGYCGLTECIPTAQSLAYTLGAHNNDQSFLRHLHELREIND
ncbi:unnamed protein product [Agarophyton chilense]